MLDKIAPPDSIHLRAAEGWLGLGNCNEAEAELHSISKDFQLHPEVLSVRWQIYAKVGKWEASLEVATSLVEKYPERIDGWIHKGYSMRRSQGGGIILAREILLEAVRRFPKEPMIHFNLACYACQLGDLEAARRWLELPLTGEYAEAFKSMAANDPDLKPLEKPSAGESA